MLDTSGTSVTTSQVVEGVQQLVVFQMPPPSEPEYTVIAPGDVVVGSTRSTLTRPETEP